MSSSGSQQATWDWSCWVCPCRTVWRHRWWGISPINILWVLKQTWIALSSLQACYLDCKVNPLCVFVFIRPPGAGSWWSEVSQLRLASVSSAPLPSFTSRGETFETLLRLRNTTTFLELHLLSALFLFLFVRVCSRLWLLVLMLGVIGFSLGMTAIPTFPEIIGCA